MADPLIRFEVADGIGILTLERPDKLNALSPELGVEFERAVAALESDPAVRVVVLRGSGRAFSAGGDLAFLEANATLDRETGTERMQAFYAQFLAIRRLGVPTIAVLHGRATGAGLSLALGCDLRVADEQAVVSANFVRLGLTPGMGMTYTLARLVGPARGAELLLTGRDVSMGEALAIGLVNHLAPEGKAEAIALDLARTIAANAPQAVRWTKQLLLAEAPDLAEALHLEAEAQAECFTTEDYREGLRAIRERRAARFTGK
jgi:enoyl-CoA hydratase